MRDDAIPTVYDMTSRNPDLGRFSCPTGGELWWGGLPGSETQLYSHSLRIERKHVTFDLRENSRGRFVRVIEEVSGRRNTIIIPLTGIDDFRDALDEVISLLADLRSAWAEAEIIVRSEAGVPAERAA